LKSSNGAGVVAATTPKVAWARWVTIGAPAWKRRKLPTSGRSNGSASQTGVSRSARVRR
jgi:hypothetical protein